LAVLIEALAAIQGSPPIELRIAGVVEHDAYWSHCQRIQATATAANPRLKVTYLGHLDYSATDELFRQSDMVTIPSQWPEPLGTVAIEAMSAGAAVIASHIGGLDTALVDGHNGLLISDPPNVAAWSAAIESLLHSPERARQLGTQAHRDLAATTATDHLQALDRIISLARRRRPPTTRN
jgi:glycosyltransferase involved in cell wall biosynthesis